MMLSNGFRWPAGFQSAAVFTFDVDGSAEQQLYEGNILGANSVGDYGPKVGLPRILNLLERQGLSATFFVAAWIAERFPERIVEISKRGHEIGTHGYLHENLTKLTDTEEAAIHDRSIEVLTRISGVRPRAFRAPIGGLHSPRTLRMLRERGFDCDSSSTGSYFPSRVNLDGKELAMAEVPFSFLLDDFPYFWGGTEGVPPKFFPMTQPVEAFEYWSSEFEGIHAIGGLFVSLCHPRAIGRYSRLRYLEQLIERVKQTPRVWLTDLRSVVEWVLRGRGEA